MKVSLKLKLISVMLASIGMSGAASAAVSAAEADQLGKNLTQWGAEKAGNAAGTIPAHAPLPQDTSPPGWVKGSGRYEVGPYDNEKPLFTITAANVSKYAENLTAGQLELFKTYPAFRMHIYPTHRSEVWPSKEVSYCKKNALNAKLVNAEGDGVEGAYSCIPFPIPKNGYEVIWNSYLRPIGYNSTAPLVTMVVTVNNRAIPAAIASAENVHPYHDPAETSLKGDFYRKRISRVLGPPYQMGQVSLTWTPINYLKSDIVGFLYTPGQRRVRLAPNNSYDTPSPQNMGAIVFDEVNGQDGRLDRWDIKLLGKTEKYVQYNVHRLFNATVEEMIKTPFFINPDVTRWELHRVWVVELTLKNGKRHRDSRRTLYVDEDTWSVEANDIYDQAGKINRVGFFPSIPLWDKQVSSLQAQQVYNLSKREYFMYTFRGNPPASQFQVEDTADLKKWTPAELERTGIR